METETCSTSRLSSFVCQSYITLIRLSLYESSIRSSVPTSYGSLVLYLSHSTKEKLCVKSLVVLRYILGFSLCQCHPKELEGDSWFVAELQWNMQRFLGGLVSECVWGRGVGCGTAYSASFHMGRLQSRKGGWQAAILSLRQDFIADGMLRMRCLIWMARGRILPDGSDTHRIILRSFGSKFKKKTAFFLLLWLLYSPRLSKSHCAFLL